MWHHVIWCVWVRHKRKMSWRFISRSILHIFCRILISAHLSAFYIYFWCVCVFFSSFYIHNKTWKVINIFVFVVFSYICHQWRKQKEKYVENNKCKTQVVYLDSLYDSHVISSVLYYLSPSNLLLSEPSYNPFSLYFFFGFGHHHHYHSLHNIKH